MCNSDTVEIAVQHIPSVTLTVVIFIVLTPADKYSFCVPVSGGNIFTSPRPGVSQLIVGCPAIPSVWSCVAVGDRKFRGAQHGNFLKFIIIGQLRKTGALHFGRIIF